MGILPYLTLTHFTLSNSPERYIISTAYFSSNGGGNELQIVISISPHLTLLYLTSTPCTVSTKSITWLL